MKKSQIISLFILIAFLFGCSSTQTYEEIDYTKPKLKYHPKLIYPAEAEGKNYVGVAEVYITLSETGTIEKVTLLKSSGYEVLNNAALDYCKQLVFEPAKKNGEPVGCNVIQKVNFNLLDESFSFEGYVRQMKKLYRLEKNAEGNEKNSIRNEILRKYDQLIYRLSNVVNFNSAMERVILPETSSNWKHSWDNYPLTFLLYHDFIQRYPNYRDLEIAKKYLKDALESDLQFIQRTKLTDAAEEEAKAKLVSEIMEFIEKNYPDIQIEKHPLTAELDL